MAEPLGLLQFPTGKPIEVYRCLSSYGFLHPLKARELRLGVVQSSFDQQ